MIVKSVPYRWIRRDGLRLDCKPYTSGALEALDRLESLTVRKEPLKSVTCGYDGGIYNGPHFSRTWVTEPEYGVPFLGSSAMLMADLSNLPLLRKKDAHSSKLEYLEIKPGTTMISCSGTIGRMVYARPDMSGMWTSQHIMKVVPDSAKIPPGYLYAFLSSKFGVPLVVSGTYGSIIQSIEPAHIEGLPVPRLGAVIEQEIHEKVERAAQLRANSTSAIRRVARRFDEFVGYHHKTEKTPRIRSVSSLKIQPRFDAQFYDPVVQTIRSLITGRQYSSVGEMCTSVFLPGIFKRINTNDIRYGAPYYTGASLFWLEPKPKAILSRKTKLFEQVRLEQGTILIQAFGQDGGLTGRSVWVGRHLHNTTTTHMLVRLKTESVARSAYLFGFLQSNSAYRQIACLTYGGSIPHFDERWISTVVVPIMPDMEDISRLIVSAVNGRDEALSMEHEARAIVERAIEGAS